MALVAGVDTSTQSCKVVIRDAETGALVRSGRATHPDGTEVDPAAWAVALREAIGQAGGIDDVAAIAVGGQQHGMVCLDGDGAVVRDALLLNDTRSAAAAVDRQAELGARTGQPGALAWAEAVGSVPVASFTVTKVRWLAQHEPDRADATAAVCLPHDWVTALLREQPADRLTGASVSLDSLTTDRSDASGTGYWSPQTGEYRMDLLELAMGRALAVPRVLQPHQQAGCTPSGVLIGPGAGDNAAAALGLGAAVGDVVLSIGTSGVVCAVSLVPSADPSGAVAGFADATGNFLPLVCTLNAARVLDATARMLRVSHQELSDLALAAQPGAGGLVLVPYLEGERTPNLPDATGAVHGLQLSNATAENLARAAFEGVLCGLADGLEAMLAHGVQPRRILMVGGGAAAPAMRALA
ncbi:MAG: FGGY family carbohydrate kinase, partial [Actinomycetales bacterium]